MTSPSPIEFDPDGPPRSRLYGYVYFSREDGLAETRAVFLAGCGLPDRWADRRRFVVGELGFGVGLNVLALLALWRETRPIGGQLSIFSVEAHPVDAAEAARALAVWPELAPEASLLLARWPDRRKGFHRIDLPELGATLDVAVMDAAEALTAWDGRADAWFLDGFSPASNPAMWTDALMGAVAARSAPDAHAATYTVAGQVRRALAAAGFDVARRPGFGRKRERLEARLPGSPTERPAPGVAIVGAGIAGASLARAFAAQGVTAAVFEADRPGAGASGNPAALVTPGLDAGLGPVAELHAAAFARAVRLYAGLPDAVIGRSVVQLETQPRDRDRFVRIAESDLFEPGALAPMSADAVREALGEAAGDGGGLRLDSALIVDAAAVLAGWLPAVSIGQVARLEAVAGGWSLLDPSGQELARADVVCLATGAELAGLWREAPIQPVRGQLTWTDEVEAPGAVAWGAYVAPLRRGLMFGATHDRDDTARDPRPADDRRNLAALASRLPALAAQAAGAPLRRRASIRATTPDRRPLAGLVAPGLVVLGGLGSRGFSLAPLLAEHLVAVALGAPSPLPAPLHRLVDPGRFADRARRRTPSAKGTASPDESARGRLVRRDHR